MVVAVTISLSFRWLAQKLYQRHRYLFYWICYIIGSRGGSTSAGIGRIITAIASISAITFVASFEILSFNLFKYFSGFYAQFLSLRILHNLFWRFFTFTLKMI